MEIVGIVGLGVGVVAAAAGVALFVTHGSSHPASARIDITPLREGGAMLGVTGTF